MINETAKKILAFQRPDGFVPSVDIGTTGIYDVPFSHLQEMARLWLKHNERQDISEFRNTDESVKRAGHGVT